MGAVLYAMVNEVAEVSKAGQRHGVCHRCGWRGEVAKVSRRDRRRANSETTYGRLCEECSTELFSASGNPDLHLHSDAEHSATTNHGDVGQESFRRRSAS